MKLKNWKLRGGSFTSQRGAVRTMLIASAVAITSSLAVAAPKGELVVINWTPGSERESIVALEKAFMAKYPDVKIREISVTWTGDARGAIRTILLGGEKADLLINTWPAFRKELAEGGFLRPLDNVWATNQWDTKLSQSWKDIGSVGDKVYGVQYNYGNRSGLWYRTDTLKKAGVSETPKTWKEFTESLEKLKKVGVTPLVVPGKAWAHAETFETLLLRLGGTDASEKLANHEIAWNSDIVKKTLRTWRELLQAGYGGDAPQMLATDWDNAADAVLKDAKGGYFQLGMWINNRAQATYKLSPGKDYSLFQFPSLGVGFDNTSSVDSKEFLAINSGRNSEAADAFLDFAISAEGAAIFAKHGFTSPSKALDSSLLDPVSKISYDLVAGKDVIFVLGDRLPSELGDEYRIQFQKFLQDSSDANIDKITNALEAKAKEVY